MRRACSTLSASGLCSLLLAAAGAQAAAAGQDQRTTLRIEAQEVIVNCTVLDGKGELVGGLTKADFTVAEDKKPQSIILVQHQDTPVSIGLLVDDSGSMEPKRAGVTGAALDLVKASNPQDESFVLNFSDQAYLDQDFTSDIGKLEKGLSHPALSGGTALYDTVVTAASKMERDAKRPRKVLIIVTDGNDNSSQATLRDAIRRVQDMQGPAIYSIGLLFGPGGSRQAQHSLEALSAETGGIAFFPKSLAEVDSVATQVARDIRNQYAVSYRSDHEAVPGYHRIDVNAHRSGSGRLKVYTRLGYRR